MMHILSKSTAKQQDLVFFFFVKQFKVFILSLQKGRDWVAYDTHLAHFFFFFNLIFFNYYFFLL